MAQTANEQLLDHAISHTVDLTRYSNGVVRRMVALLNRADPDLVAQIGAALERLPAASFTVGQLTSVLASVRDINAAAYAAVFNALPADMQGLVQYEVGWQNGALTSAIPDAVLVQFPLAQVSVSQVYAAAMSRPFQGGLLKDWAASTEANRMAAIRNAIRLGYVEGQTTDQIVRRIRGTAAAGYSDGVLQGSRQGLTAVVRTALSHTAATAREQVYAANGDIIKAVGWCSVLDAKTTEMCRIRDGLEYSADATHKPLGHGVPMVTRAGPASFLLSKHFNRRHQVVAGTRH